MRRSQRREIITANQNCVTCLQPMKMMRISQSEHREMITANQNSVTLSQPIRSTWHDYSQSEQWDTILTNQNHMEHHNQWFSGKEAEHFACHDHVWFWQTLKIHAPNANLLVAPIQTCRDVLFDVPHAVVCQVTHQNLPSQVQYLIHHVPQSMKQITFVFLRGERIRKVKALTREHSCTTEI